MRRSKVKVLQADVETQGSADAERDVEYMPPREVPLPDNPDDFPQDRTYPQFQGKNFTRGWYSEFTTKRDDKDDEDSELSDFDEKIRTLENKKKQQAERKPAHPTITKATPLPTKRNPLAERAPSTLAARKASSALSSRSTSGTAPRNFAAPTASTKARVPGLPSSRKPTPATSTAPGNPRHKAARAASNTTLGYSKGRAVSGAAARRPLDAIHKKPESRPSSSGASAAPFAGGGTSLDQLLGLSLEDDREDDELGAKVDPMAGEDEDEVLRDFQLDAA